MNSFQIEQEISILAKSEKVFDRLVNDVGSWWNHSFIDNPKAIILEAKIGGRFYEDFGEGDGALYSTVVQIVKNKKLVLQGSMGMSGAVFGNIIIDLQELSGSTILKLSHHAYGDVTEEHKKSYSAGWQALLGTRLKALVETGACGAS